MYSELKNISKVEETFKRGPQPVKKAQNEIQPCAQTKNLTGDVANYEKDWDAASENATRNELERGNLIMTDSEHYDRTVEKLKSLIIAN